MWVCGGGGGVYVRVCSRKSCCPWFSDWFSAYWSIGLCSIEFYSYMYCWMYCCTKQHHTVHVVTNSTCGWKVSRWTSLANTSSATDFHDHTPHQLIAPVKDPLTANVKTTFKTTFQDNFHSISFHFISFGFLWFHSSVFFFLVFPLSIKVHFSSSFDKTLWFDWLSLVFFFFLLFSPFFFFSLMLPF